MQDYKRKTASDGLFIPIAPSQWMADEAMNSGMFSTRPRVIPYGVDTNFFRPQNHERVRAELGLPADRFTVIINVQDISSKRKGIADGLKAVKRVNPNPFVLALGSVKQEASSFFKGIEVEFPGYVSDRKLLARYCAAADVLLFPTFADNLPLAVLEAMACGTPTVGYRTGGMPDMVEHGENGWLAQTGDIEGLSDGLNLAQSDSETLKTWSANCRSKARSHFSESAFINAHLALYEEIFENRSKILPHLGAP